MYPRSSTCIIRTDRGTFESFQACLLRRGGPFSICSIDSMLQVWKLVSNTTKLVQKLFSKLKLEVQESNFERWVCVSLLTSINLWISFFVYIFEELGFKIGMTTWQVPTAMIFPSAYPTQISLSSPPPPPYPF